MANSYLPADARLIYLPYVLERLEDGRYVVLNRRYKPLGTTTMGFVEYAPHAVRLKGLGATTAAKLSWSGSADLDKIWLYSDGCVPTDSAANWDAYQQRLAALAKLRVE